MSPEASPGGGRRQRLLQVASAAVFLTIVAVAVLIVVNQTKTEGGDTELEGVAAAKEALAGVHQDGLVLGDPAARVTLVEFGDLKCPVCAAYAEEVIPQVIDSKVRDGEAKIDFRNYTIIGNGEESTLAGAAAIAAGKQGHGWDFIEIFYRNQGLETADYVTDAFLTAAARAAGVPDIARWNRERRSEAALSQVSGSTEEAASSPLNFDATPSFAVAGPATDGLEGKGPLESVGEIEDAIDAAGA